MSDMYALESVRHLGKWLPIAVKDGNNLEAREHVAFANTLSGFVMTTTRLTSQHAMEHALSSFIKNCLMARVSSCFRWPTLVT